MKDTDVNSKLLDLKAYSNEPDVISAERVIPVVEKAATPPVESRSITKVIPLSKFQQIFNSQPTNAEDLALHNFLKVHNSRNSLTWTFLQSNSLYSIDDSPIEKLWMTRDFEVTYIINMDHPYSRTCLQQTVAEKQPKPVEPKKVQNNVGPVERKPKAYSAARKAHRTIELKEFERIMNYGARNPEEWEICGFAKTHETTIPIIETLKTKRVLNTPDRFSFAVEGIRMASDGSIEYIINLDYLNKKIETMRKRDECLKNDRRTNGNPLKREIGVFTNGINRNQNIPKKLKVDNVETAPSGPHTPGRRVVKMLTLEQFHRIMESTSNTLEDWAIVLFARSLECQGPIMEVLKKRNIFSTTEDSNLPVDNMWMHGQEIGFMINMDHEKLVGLPNSPSPTAHVPDSNNQVKPGKQETPQYNHRQQHPTGSQNKVISLNFAIEKLLR
ncbi:unnamed protein product [Caenorhabditis brenneri]